jgi:hypothetical protein
MNPLQCTQAELNLDDIVAYDPTALTPNQRLELGCHGIAVLILQALFRVTPCNQIHLSSVFIARASSPPQPWLCSNTP